MDMDKVTDRAADMFQTKCKKPEMCQDENPVVNETRKKREGIRRLVIKCL